MALSQAELEQVKFYLGYGNLSALARPYFDIAVTFENVVQKSLDTTWAEGYVRTTLLANIAAIEVQIQQQVLLQAQATELVGEVKIDAQYAMQSLVALQNHWIDKLSSAIKVPRVPMGGGSNVVLT